MAAFHRASQIPDNSFVVLPGSGVNNLQKIAYNLDGISHYGTPSRRQARSAGCDQNVEGRDEKVSRGSEALTLVTMGMVFVVIVRMGVSRLIMRVLVGVLAACVGRVVVRMLVMVVFMGVFVGMCDLIVSVCMRMICHANPSLRFLPVQGAKLYNP